jgi:dipeptidyl aminopeptidase/acylaminoacyl peptidase
VYLADLQTHGMGITTPRRLTLNEGRDYPAAWTPDSRAIVFVSNRNGQWELFRQSLDEDTARSIAAVSAGEAERTEAGEFSPTVPRISPDGAWMLFLIWKKKGNSSAQTELVRVPITGGPPQLVLTGSSGLIHSFRCARFPATLCALAERTPDHKQLIFTAFDPVNGRDHELTRFSTSPTPDAEYAWDLSPDGTGVAILKRSEATIHVLSLSRQPSQEIVAKGWSGLQTLDWAADGAGLFVAIAREEGSALLHLDLKGSGQLLWASKGTVEPGVSAFIGGPTVPWAVPSPDGRHLAICEWNLSANIWMMENF